MTSSIWIGAAVVSVVAHVSFATWVDRHERAQPAPLPPVEMRFVAPPPKHVEPPPPPPPPPKLVEPPPPPPRHVVHATVKPVAAPVAPAPRAGLTPDPEPTPGPAVASGDGLEGDPNGTEPPAPPSPIAAPPPPPPPPAPAGKHFVPEYKVTQLPLARSPIHPELPASLRNTAAELHVTVEVEIDEAGRVVHVRVLGRADAELAAAVIAAVEHAAFSPALVGTQPVPVRFHIPFTFRVHG